MAETSTVFTKLFRSIKARNKAIAKAGGGTPGKRIKVTDTIGISNSTAKGSKLN